MMATAATDLAGRGDWKITMMSLSRRLDTSFMDELGQGIQVRYGSGRGQFPSEWPALRRLPTEEFDLVFASHFRVNAALSAARRVGLLKTKRLVTRESTVLTDRARGARLLAYKLLYRAYGAQDEIWAQTSYMADRVKEVLPTSAASKVRVVPNPVDVMGVRARAMQALPQEWAERLQQRSYIAWCGRLIDIKNPVLAVDTLAALHQMGKSDTGLLFIGSGPLEAEVREAAARRGLQDAVAFAGQQANPFPLMRMCRAGLLTSRREGFPNVLLEMMSIDIPSIITTDCAGDLGSLSGVDVVAAQEPGDLAAALALRLSKPAFQESSYSRVLRTRNPASFVERLLGEGSLSA